MCTGYLYGVPVFKGVGFVGRNLTSYLVKNEFVSKVRVVDKVPPATGWLNEDHKVGRERGCWLYRLLAFAYHILFCGFSCN